MADKVTCPNCALSVSRANLSRHCRVVHGEASSQRVCRRVTTDSEPRSSSRNAAISDDPARIPTSRSAAPPTVIDRPSRSSTYLLMDAVRSLLEQHHLITEEQMCEFLRVNFSGIPEHQLFALVVGAVTGAQYAANFHFIVERNKTSRDAAKREVAINAGSSLSFWNLGFVSSMRPLPGVLSSTGVGNAPGLNASMSPPVTVRLPDLQLPVLFAQSCADFDVLQAAAVEAGINEVPSFQATSNTITATSSSVMGVQNTSLQSVEPYVPPALSSSTACAVDYHPTPPAELSRVPRPDVNQSPYPEEPDLVVEVDPAEMEPLVEGGLTPSTPLSPKRTLPTTSSVASSVTKPTGRSDSHQKRTIDFHEYKKRRAENPVRAAHPRSRTPPRRRSTVPRWTPRGSSSRSPRINRRDESPPRRLVLTGDELQEFLKYKGNPCQN